MLSIFKQAASKKEAWPFSHEIKIIFSVAITIFLGVSLISYRHTDCSWFYFDSSGHAIGNWCGMVGAYTASLSYYLFGTAALLLIFFSCYWVYFLVLHKTIQEEWDRVVAYVALLYTLAAVFAFHRCTILARGIPGGFFGRFVCNTLQALFDTIGTIIFLYTLLFVCILIISRVSFMRVMKKIYYLACSKAVKSRIVYPARRLVVSGYSYLYSLAMRHLQRVLERAGWQCTEQKQEEFSFEGGTLDDLDLQDLFNKEAWHGFSPTNTPDKNSPETAQAPMPIYQETQYNAADLAQKEIPAPLYELPKLDMFIGVDEEHNDHALMQELEKRAGALQEKLERFGVFGKVTAIKRGPVVTLFEYQPHIDTKISKIVALEDDLSLALQATSIRIIAPIPGRSVVGFEVANKQRRGVLLSHLIKSDAYEETTASLPMILGVDTIGNTVIIDLSKMPHLLMAGSTGSGKSVALNAMLISLLCKVSPDDLRLVIIDPKRLEFAPYADIAHLLFPIVTDPKLAPPVLRWVVKQMETRYEIMAQSGARNIADYRAIAQKNNLDSMPFIIVVIDELADLMMTAGKEVEDAIIRITQMARAAGIHLIAATQRPSVDVITGLIKVNFPSRISFRVTSKIDSRTILDCAGADKLLGKGDMLFLDANDALLKRVHGAYVLDKEIHQVIGHIKSQRAADYLDVKQVCQEDRVTVDFEQDAMYEQICQFLHEIDEVSISLLQRRFRIGYNRSARIIDMLESEGLIAPSYGGKTRKVIR